VRKLLFNYSLYSHPEIGNFRVGQKFSTDEVIIFFKACQFIPLFHDKKKMSMRQTPFLKLDNIHMCPNPPKYMLFQQLILRLL
jgi:hypothetical protein